MRINATSSADQEGRIGAMVGALEKAEEGHGHDVQLAVDDLIYDHCGTSKRWSGVNNQGYDGQVRALVKAVGLEDTEELVREIVRGQAGGPSPKPSR